VLLALLPLNMVRGVCKRFVEKSFIFRLIIGHLVAGGLNGVRGLVCGLREDRYKLG
jgi:hypothetical protein